MKIVSSCPDFFETASTSHMAVKILKGSDGVLLMSGEYFTNVSWLGDTPLSLFDLCYNLQNLEHLMNSKSIILLLNRSKVC